jgi:hypothetical protein
MQTIRPNLANTLHTAPLIYASTSMHRSITTGKTPELITATTQHCHCKYQNITWYHRAIAIVTHANSMPNTPPHGNAAGSMCQVACLTMVPYHRTQTAVADPQMVALKAHHLWPQSLSTHGLQMRNKLYPTCSYEHRKTHKFPFSKWQGMHKTFTGPTLPHNSWPKSNAHQCSTSPVLRPLYALRDSQNLHPILDDAKWC